MILGFVFALLSLTAFALFASAVVEVRVRGKVTESSSLSSSVFTLVFMFGVSVIFAVMTYMRFSGSI